MGGQHREGENLLGRIVEGAAIGAATAAVGEGLREAYRPGYQNLPQGFQGDARGQNSLPRIEIDRMHEDSRHAAGDLINSGGRDQRLAQTELQHAALVDREYGQQGRYYQEALRELSKDVREQSRDQERLSVGQGYNGRPDLRIESNNEPLYRQPAPPPGSYYHPGNVYAPREQFKR
jgi:hypothetical protein